MKDIKKKLNEQFAVIACHYNTPPTKKSFQLLIWEAQWPRPCEKFVLSVFEILYKSICYKGDNSMRSSNLFYEQNGYMVGITRKGDKFLFDKDDYLKVRKHTWYSTDISGDKYIFTRIKVDGIIKTVLLHRFLMNPSNKNDIDHINNNSLDNRKINLRECSHSCNMRNRRKNKPGSSKYKGVYFYKPLNKWNAQIEIKGKKIHLGYYQDEIEAAKAYNLAALLYHREFALLNII